MRRRESGGSLLVRRLAVLLSLMFVTVATPVTVHASVSTFQAKGTFPDDNDLTVGPLIGGTGSYVEGTYAWTGYPYSDTTKYPSGSENLANLIQLQLSLARGGELRIRAILETLVDPRPPLLGVGFDTDNDPATGAPSVPGGGWIAKDPIGLDTFVTVSSEKATLSRWNGSKLSEVGSFVSQVDPRTNSMSTVVPETLLRPGRASWRTVGVLGLGGDNSWVEGRGAIYNLAFVNCSDFACIVRARGGQLPFTDTPGWQDGAQQDILAGNLTSSRAVGLVEFSKIARAVTELASITTPGYHTLLYYSNLDLGEGFRPTTDNPSCVAVPCTIYAGPYQPYLVQVPKHLGHPAPVIFHLHGDNHNHLNSLGCTNERRSNCSLGAFSDFDSPALIVYPMGRGTHLGWGGGDGAFGLPLAAGAYAEADVLSVLDDVTKRFQIDPDRVVIHGTSLGALGAFKIAEYHPDLFAGMLAASGGDCCILPVNHFQPRRLENLINVPVRMVNGAVDPLAHVGAAADTWVALDRLGDVDYLGFEAFPRHHEEFDDLADCILHDFLKNRTRVLDPARVVYIVDPAHEINDLKTTGLDMTHHGAYWVSGLEVRGAAEARIDATTKARAIRTTKGTPVNEPGQNITEGADYCGPNPAVQKNNVWLVHGISLAPGKEQPTSNAMDLTLLQYSRAALDLTRMGISVSDPISISVTGDGKSEVALVGPWHEGQKVDVTKDGGAFATLVATDGAVTVSDDFSGTHEYVLIPAAKGRGQSDCTSASQNCERDFGNQSHPDSGNAPPADVGLPLHRLSNTAGADGDRVPWPAVFALLAGAASFLMITRRRDA